MNIEFDRNNPSHIQRYKETVKFVIDTKVASIVKEATEKKQPVDSREKIRKLLIENYKNDHKKFKQLFHEAMQAANKKCFELGVKMRNTSKRDLSEKSNQDNESLLNEFVLAEEMHANVWQAVGVSEQYDKLIDDALENAK